jgi:hypothetical protein
MDPSSKNMKPYSFHVHVNDMHTAFERQFGQSPRSTVQRHRRIVSKPRIAHELLVCADVVESNDTAVDEYSF